MSGSLLLKKKWSNVYPFGVGIFISSFLFSLLSCGKPSESSHSSGEASGQNPGSSSVIEVPVEGKIKFGNQCPYGSETEPGIGDLQLFDCPMNVSKVEFAEEIEPLFISADCNKKLITVRTRTKAVDTTWEAMPDGSFYFTLTGIPAKLKSDGVTNTPCQLSMRVDMFGKLICQDNNDRDKVDINVETVWWLDQPIAGNVPVPIPSPTHTRGPSPRLRVDSSFDRDFFSNSTPQCKVKNSCYFYTAAKIKQCQ